VTGNATVLDCIYLNHVRKILIIPAKENADSLKRETVSIIWVTLRFCRRSLNRITIHV